MLYVQPCASAVMPSLPPDRQREKERLLRDQGWRCPVCAKPLTLSKSHLDHDHQTGLLRAVLCSNDNMILGLAHDDSARLRRAADYLDKFDAA